MALPSNCPTPLSGTPRWTVNLELQKFPSTPHLAWLGSQPVRNDKVMTSNEAAAMLAAEVTIEEKIDGANLGISFDARGDIHFQNRGNWLEGKFTGQWERLRGWAAAQEQSLREHLPHGHVLFGEWCYARHSVGYDHLPDWFIAFDIYDSLETRFWSTVRRNHILERIGIPPVPKVAHGRFCIEELMNMLDAQSDFSTSLREGVYLRQENEDWLIHRAKLVRPEFVQHIGDHWSKSAIQVNTVSVLPS
jgi:RNA ligase